LTSPPIISASGLEALEGENGCARRAYNTYVRGVREDAGNGAHAGTLIHKMLENYLVGNNDIDESIMWEGYEVGATAKAMAELLPEPRPNHNVEGNFSLEVEGVHFRGFIDLIDMPVFYDHKSTSGKRWAKTKKTLPTNIQFQMYARYIDEDSVGQWTYGLTRFDPERDKKRAWAVKVKVEKQKIRDSFGEIVLKPAHRFLRMLEAKDINDLDPNYSSCHAYNKTCPLHPSVGGDCHHPSVEKKFMSLLKNKKPLIEKLREESVEQGDGINSPPMPRGQEVITTMSDDDIARLPWTGTTEQIETFLSGPDFVSDSAEPVKKRGRPRKNVIAATGSLVELQVYEKQFCIPDVQTAVSPEAIEEALTSHTAPTFEEYAAVVKEWDAPAPTKPIHTLYISCLPLGNLDMTYAHDLIAKSAETVCADMQLLHFALAEYGKGPAMLATQLKADLLEEPVRNLYLDGKSTESYGIKQTLMSLAQNIVVGGV